MLKLLIIASLCLFASAANAIGTDDDDSFSPQEQFAIRVAYRMLVLRTCMLSPSETDNALIREAGRQGLMKEVFGRLDEMRHVLEVSVPEPKKICAAENVQ